MTTNSTVLPPHLIGFLQHGAPAILATVDEEGWPHLVMTWAAARDDHTVRFVADLHTTTSANLEREGRATLQVTGANNLLFLIKGDIRRVKERIEAAPFPMAIMELKATSVKDQAWEHAVVAPLTYQWVGDSREEMASMERAVLDELRQWEARPPD
jgi:predicted pyridoxine 5'-phosphate oxidase superfamily flavin-nucleotide-binding protein